MRSELIANLRRVAQRPSANRLRIAMVAKNASIADYDGEKLARLAELRYVSDAEIGYSRAKNGHGFYYLTSRNARIHDERKVARIEYLAIPPAWTEVWICRFANGHLQATGRDDRKRKQYLYHERWRAVADAAKFIRLEEFGRALPRLRRQIAGKLRGNEVHRSRVLAGMIALLDTTSIRIGNEEYVRANNSYGLASLRSRHIKSKPGGVELRFRAKGGKPREILLHDRRLVRLLRQLRRVPGSHLFQFRNGENRFSNVDATDVNAYLSELAGHAVTAKDFRTWKASALAIGMLADQLDVDSIGRRKNLLKAAIAEVAEVLGNTPAIARKSYIHAGILEAFTAGELQKYLKGFRFRRNCLAHDEQLLLHFSRRWNARRRVSF